MYCEEPDFQYPLQADVFYPVVEQGAYGNVKKQWIVDKTIAVSLSSGGNAMKEDIKPNVNITKEQILVGRTRRDPRISMRDEAHGATNVVLSNIRDKNCNHVYVETSGVRAGKSTIFEIASIEPFIGPFGDAESYKIVIRRSENQAVDV